MSQDAEIRIDVGNGLYLSPITMADKPALLEHMQAKEIYDATLTVPYPYTPADADKWIQSKLELTQRLGFETNLAIRTAEGYLIGSIAVDDVEPHGPDGQRFASVTAHRGQLGYWLALPYWGKGLMTGVVRAFVGYVFKEIGLLRITATVFTTNPGSKRVLEKTGFREEGTLRSYYLKDGKLMDVTVFGLLSSDWNGE